MQQKSIDPFRLNFSQEVPKWRLIKVGVTSADGDQVKWLKIDVLEFLATGINFLERVEGFFLSSKKKYEILPRWWWSGIRLRFQRTLVRTLQELGFFSFSPSILSCVKISRMSYIRRFPTYSGIN